MSRVGAYVRLRRDRGADRIRPFSTGRRHEVRPSWQTRSNVTEEVDARSLQVFSKWSPNEGTTFLQFVARIDGAGGFAVVETDDPALIARDTAIFSAFFDMSVYPVLDIEEAARIGGAAIEFRQSV